MYHALRAGEGVEMRICSQFLVGLDVSAFPVEEEAEGCVDEEGEDSGVEEGGPHCR